MIGPISACNVRYIRTRTVQNPWHFSLEMNLGHAETSTWIINSPLSRERGEGQARGKCDAHERARKGASPEVTREPETKRDVNLARKTLFSPGKVVNGRLGSRLPIVGASIAYELVLQDKSEPFPSPPCDVAGGRGSALCRSNECSELRRRLSNTAATFPRDERSDIRRSKLVTFDISLEKFIESSHSMWIISLWDMRENARFFWFMFSSIQLNKSRRLNMKMKLLSNRNRKIKRRPRDLTKENFKSTMWLNKML